MTVKMIPVSCLISLTAARAAGGAHEARRQNDVTPTTNPPRAAFAASQLLSDCAGAAGAGRASRANFRARRMFGSSELLSKVRSLKQFGHCI